MSARPAASSAFATTNSTGKHLLTITPEDHWLGRHALALLGWLAAAAGVAAVLFGARQGGRTAAPVEDMRRRIEVQRDQLEAASGRPRDCGELARRMRDGTF